MKCLRACRHFLFGLSLFGLALSAGEPAHAQDEASVALRQINEAVHLIDVIMRDTPRRSKGQLFLIQKELREIETSIESVGLSNLKTLYKYQVVIRRLRYSTSFFQEIECPINHKAVKRLLEIRDEIWKARGFDDSPYTQITASDFSQIHSLFLQLTEGTVLPDSLREKMRALIPDIANVIAKGKAWGDRRLIYPVAIPVSRKIAELYPEFNQILSSHAAYNAILEIQGLNESYSEFAQFETQKEKETGEEPTPENDEKKP